MFNNPDSSPPSNISWHIQLISFLVIAIRVRDDRIERLEELNYEGAVELDRLFTEESRREAA